MKNTITIILLSFCAACAQEKEHEPSSEAVAAWDPSIPVLDVSMYDSPLLDYNIALEQPYDIEYYVEKVEEDEFNIIINMKLFGGSFYVSPHSTRDFKGQFMIEVAPNKDLTLEDDFVETPRSKEVIDFHPFVSGPVNWVSEDTQYQYHLKVNTEDDFSIGGKILFVIEPKCTLENIPLLFKYEGGVLTVELAKC